MATCKTALYVQAAWVDVCGYFLCTQLKEQFSAVIEQGHIWFGDIHFLAHRIFKGLWVGTLSIDWHLQGRVTGVSPSVHMMLHHQRKGPASALADLGAIAFTCSLQLSKDCKLNRNLEGFSMRTAGRLREVSYTSFSTENVVKERGS